MNIVLHNALLVGLDPPQVERGGLRIGGGQILERGLHCEPTAADQSFDCGGAVVLPGLVNGHTHLYSALAVGMPPPAKPPRDFLEILQFVWWRLDQALDAESIETSARVGALDAVRSGTTTLIDHHASPHLIEGSLDLVERGIAAVGARAVLCYETTDRHGAAGRQAGLAENRRYLKAKAEGACDHQFAGLVGAHAAFTLEDQTLDELAALAREYGSGVHLHVAEDPCDADLCRHVHQAELIDRLAGHGLLKTPSIFAHGTHLDAQAIARVNAAGLTLAHNPRSNMNNAVGYAPVDQFRCPVLLGTDGIGQDLLAEARHAWFMSRAARASITPQQIIAMLAAGARRASQDLDLTLGVLRPGAAADIVVTDYQPSTPMTAGNLAGHLLFALDSRQVRDVMINGRWVVRERTVITTDETADRRQAVETAGRLWKRMGQI